MATDFVVGATPSYCTSSDVARLLNKPVNYFTTSSTPDIESVNSFIFEAEEIVDKDTQSAWRERKVTNEYHTIDRNQYYEYQTGYRIKLVHKFLRPLSSVAGDKLEVWNGQVYEDYLLTRTEGRGNDFWLDYERGVLFIRGVLFRTRESQFRVTYRYGMTTVPANIKQATALRAAIMLIVNEDNSFMLNETGESRNMPYDARVAKYEQQYKRIVFSQEQDIFVV
jgi:hypothetical protein